MKKCLPHQTRGLLDSSAKSEKDRDRLRGQIKGAVDDLKSKNSKRNSEAANFAKKKRRSRSAESRFAVYNHSRYLNTG